MAIRSRLPPEMVMAIIDHLHDDHPSLRACSLVCKAWTHPARMLLFSWLTLTWPLQSAVFPFVRHLRIFIPDTKMRRGGAPTWDNIFPLLVGLCRIVSLDIKLWDRLLDNMNPQLWSSIGNNLSRVVSLTLSGFSFINASSLARAICAFPCLRELSIHTFTLLTSTQALESELLPTLPLPPNLDTLNLSCMSINAILEWLLSLSTRPVLRTVRLQQLYEEDLAMFDTFIETFRDDLESICLSVSINAWTHHSIDITPLTRLRSIRFVFRGGHRGKGNRWITQVLSQMDTPHLQDVVFELHPIDLATDSGISVALEWSEVDAILQRPTFSQLKNVEFQHGLCPWHFGPEPRRRPFPAQVVMCLSRCQARGILLG